MRLMWTSCCFCAQQCSAALRRCHSIQTKIDDLRLASRSPSASPTKQRLPSADGQAPAITLTGQPPDGALMNLVRQCLLAGLALCRVFLLPFISKCCTLRYRTSPRKWVCLFRRGLQDPGHPAGPTHTAGAAAAAGGCGVGAGCSSGRPGGGGGAQGSGHAAPSLTAGHPQVRASASSCTCALCTHLRWAQASASSILGV